MDKLPKGFEYNDIPVYYCTQCLSLRIIGAGWDNFCDECNSTDIAQTNIFDWEKLYEQRYGYKFLDKSKH
jgi:hypothetical protein